MKTGEGLIYKSTGSWYMLRDNAGRTWQARMDRREAHLRQDAHPDEQGTDDERVNPDGN